MTPSPQSPHASEAPNGVDLTPDPPEAPQGVSDETLAIRILVNGCKGDATASTRQKPRKAVKDRILAKQDNRCLYCDMPFGTEILRNYKPVTLRLNWDHFVPYWYLANNPNDNWVAACHVCNLIKAARVFDTLAEARRYVVNRAIEKGYVYPRPGQAGGTR